MASVNLGQSEAALPSDVQGMDTQLHTLISFALLVACIRELAPPAYS